MYSSNTGSLKIIQHVQVDNVKIFNMVTNTLKKYIPVHTCIYTLVLLKAFHQSFLI